MFSKELVRYFINYKHNCEDKEEENTIQEIPFKDVKNPIPAWVHVLIKY